MRLLFFPFSKPLFVVELTGFRMTAIKLIMAIIIIIIIIIERADKWYPHTRTHTHTHTHTHTYIHRQARTRPNQCVNSKMLHFLCNQALHADREVTENGPDIIIKTKTEKTRILLNMSIHVDRNVVQKEAGKKLKYESLCTEIQRMWNMKCMIVPVITGATGIVTKGLKNFLKAIPGKHSTDTLQKTAILGTSHVIWKVLQCETRSLSGGLPLVQEKYQEE
jgi:hypothetical protein